MPAATNSEQPAPPSSTVLDELDARHHQMWRDAQSQHIAQNHTLTEQRVQSLTISHRARCRLLEDQVAAATNDKIQLMKQSELGRANADFQRRKDELAQAAKSADVHAAPVVMGFITNTREVTP